MPIDPRIPMQATAADIGSSFLGGYDRGQRMQQFSQQQRLAALQEKEQAMQLAQMKRAASREQATEGALSAAGGNIEQALPSLMKVNPALGLQLSKELRAMKTDDLQRAKLKMEQDLQSIDAQGRILGSATDEASYQSALAQLQQMDVDVSTLPKAFDPGAVKFYANKALSVKQKADIAHQAAIEALQERGVKVQEGREARESADAAIRRPGWQAEAQIKAGQAAFQSKDPEMLLPGERASAKRSEASLKQQEAAMKQRAADAAAGRSIAARGQDIIMRGQNMADARSKQSLELQKEGMTAGQVTKTAELDTALNIIGDLRKTVEDHKADIGPIIGLAPKIPIFGSYFEDANKAQASIDLIRQKIGKAFEGGVLRKEDEAKYERILPKLTDKIEVARDKIDKVEAALKTDIANYLRRMHQTGKAQSADNPHINLKDFER